MQGGRKGLFQNSTNICHDANRATLQVNGQNGKLHEFEPVLTAQCGGKGKKGGKAKNGKRAARVGGSE